MLNGRFNIPIWILEGYAGAGIGTFYYDAEASGAVSADEDGFLFGGNAFLGASLNIAEALALGLEFKYYVTDDISNDIEAGLDAYALMLTLGWSR
jgi:methylaspartate ammonia-lyase